MLLEGKCALVRPERLAARPSSDANTPTRATWQVWVWTRCALRQQHAAPELCARALGAHLGPELLWRRVVHALHKDNVDKKERNAGADQDEEAPRRHEAEWRRRRGHRRR
eukprot:2835228-Prymnesium_polylepis.3